MKTQLERLLTLLILVISGLAGCTHNPVGPGSYTDATEFIWTVDTVYDPSNCQS